MAPPCENPAMTIFSTAGLFSFLCNQFFDQALRGSYPGVVLGPPPNWRMSYQARMRMPC